MAAAPSSHLNASAFKTPSLYMHRSKKSELPPALSTAMFTYISLAEALAEDNRNLAIASAWYYRRRQ